MSLTLERTISPLNGIQFDADLFPALAALRAEGWEQHTALGIPTTKDEAWKYTSLRDLSEAYFLQGGRPTLTVGQVNALVYEASDEIRLVFVNGQIDASLSSRNLPAGLRVRTIEQAIQEDGAMTLQDFGALARIHESTFAALNTATFVEATVIDIAKNAQIEAPIHVIRIAVTDPNDATSYSAPRLLVRSGAFSKATVFESYAVHGQGATFTNAVTEIFVAENGHLEHVKVQNEPLASTHIAAIEVRQEADSTYLNFNVTFGAKLTRNDINVFLNGSNLHSRMDGVVAIGGEQLVDNHTRLDHAYPHCDSFEVYKHVLADRSTAVFNGQIYVHQDAQKTDAKQTNQTLLLSDKATINTKPQLEIFADDVKCTHGATVGYLDQAPLFYLQSRGIERSHAEALMVYAFAAEVIEKIENERMRSELEALLFKTLAL
ncbi:MAG: Fe-S cluster assembly protein SufD [Chthonomonas sp.]|nr:Fe-S cluster assembly protein SufD [Chthonomonas sp.]